LGKNEKEETGTGSEEDARGSLRKVKSEQKGERYHLKHVPKCAKLGGNEVVGRGKKGNSQN